MKPPAIFESLDWDCNPNYVHQEGNGTETPCQLWTIYMKLIPDYKEMYPWIDFINITNTPLNVIDFIFYRKWHFLEHRIYQLINTTYIDYRYVYSPPFCLTPIDFLKVYSPSAAYLFKPNAINDSIAQIISFWMHINGQADIPKPRYINFSSKQAKPQVYTL